MDIETFATLSALLNGLLLGHLFDRFVNPQGHGKTSR